MSGQAGALDLERELRNFNGWFRKYVHEDANGCWIWHGSRSARGYGAAWFRGATIGAHRAIYQIMVVDLPRRLDLDHLTTHTDAPRSPIGAHRMNEFDDDMARRVADCLEDHLANYGFDPYRYPSGENKSVQMYEPGVVSLFGTDGAWVLEIRRVS